MRGRPAATTTSGEGFEWCNAASACVRDGRGCKRDSIKARVKAPLMKEAKSSVASGRRDRALRVR